MPLFATLVAVCALSGEGDKAVCEVVVRDRYQQLSQAICFNKLERERFKTAKDMMDRLKDYDLLPASHNCFQTVAHRDTTLQRMTKAYDKAGIAYTITYKD